eukprot:887558-Rhodomonas_salina.1
MNLPRMSSTRGFPSLPLKLARDWAGQTCLARARPPPRPRTQPMSARHPTTETFLDPTRSATHSILPCLPPPRP